VSDNELSLPESVWLEQAEAVVKRSAEAALEALAEFAKAHVDIRAEFASFDDYVKARWPLGKRDFEKLVGMAHSAERLLETLRHGPPIKVKAKATKPGPTERSLRGLQLSGWRCSASAFGGWSSSSAIRLLPSQIRTCGFPA
jgi:hypothetical protein